MGITYNFEGQVALVTGAASGMGLATARAFARAGAAVTLADVSEDALRQAVDEIKSAGGNAIGVLCDVADEAQVAAMVERTVAEFGRLDAAFNNAGIQVPSSEVADQSAEDYDRVNAINLRGVWACMKHELQQMRKQGSGAIVNCSSIGGLVGRAELAAYHGTKHGVIGLTRSAALEYAARGIRVNAVCPGTIDTPMVSKMLDKGMLAMDDLLRDLPMKRLGKSEEIADAVLWLCSPGSTFVTGQALAVDAVLLCNESREAEVVATSGSAGVLQTSPCTDKETHDGQRDRMCPCWPLLGRCDISPTGAPVRRLGL